MKMDVLIICERACLTPLCFKRFNCMENLPITEHKNLLLTQLLVSLLIYTELFFDARMSKMILEILKISLFLKRLYSEIKF